MWWALAAAAIPYVMQEMQGQPEQPHIPPQTHMPDRSAYEGQYLANAFNPHAELFQRASDATAEQVKRALAQSGMLGSSGGMATLANTEGTLAAKWLQDQTSREGNALGTVSGMDRDRSAYETGLGNEMYQYGAAKYNRDNAYNASQTSALSGLLQSGVMGYKMDQTQGVFNKNALAYRDAMDAMTKYYNNGPMMGVPGGGGGGGDLYSNYSQMMPGPGYRSMSPGYY